MELTREQLDALYEMTVVTADGHTLGPVGHIYLDDDSEQATWVTSRTGLFGLREVFVPFQGAHIDAGAITVRFTKDVILDAPRIAADGHISQAEQLELFHYYTRARQGAEGAAAHPAPAQPHPPQSADGLDAGDQGSVSGADSRPAGGAQPDGPAHGPDDPAHPDAPASAGVAREPADAPAGDVQQTVDDAPQDAGEEPDEESAAPALPARDIADEAGDPDPISDPEPGSGGISEPDPGGISERDPGGISEPDLVSGSPEANGDDNGTSDDEAPDHGSKPDDEASDQAPEPEDDAPDQAVQPVDDDAQQISQHRTTDDPATAEPGATPDDDSSADGAAADVAAAGEQPSPADQPVSRA